MLTMCPYFYFFLSAISVCIGSVTLNETQLTNGMKHILECILQQEHVPNFLSITLCIKFQSLCR
jgi:hypothetical protein